MNQQQHSKDTELQSVTPLAVELPFSEEEASGQSSEMLINGEDLKKFTSQTDFIDRDDTESDTDMESYTLSQRETELVSLPSSASEEQHHHLTSTNSRLLENKMAIEYQSKLAKVYTNCKIRWKNCSLCDMEDETQSGFNSELVLSVDHCWCSAIKQQRQLLTFFQVDEERYSSGSEKSISEQCNVGGSSLIQDQHDDVTLSRESRLIPIPETNPEVTTKLAVDGGEFTSNGITA